MEFIPPGDPPNVYDCDHRSQFTLSLEFIQFDAVAIFRRRGLRSHKLWYSIVFVCPYSNSALDLNRLLVGLLSARIRQTRDIALWSAP